jgi:hypothetical protein
MRIHTALRTAEGARARKVDSIDGPLDADGHVELLTEIIVNGFRT